MSSDTTLIAVSRQIEQECQQVNLNLGRMWRIFTNVLLSDSKLPILTRRSKKEPYHACKLWLRSVHFCGKVLCATLMLNGFSKAILPIIASLWTRQRNIGEKDKKKQLIGLNLTQYRGLKQWFNWALKRLKSLLARCGSLTLISQTKKVTGSCFASSNSLCLRKYGQKQSAPSLISFPFFRRYFFSDELRSFRSSRILVEMVSFVSFSPFTHALCDYYDAQIRPYEH